MQHLFGDRCLNLSDQSCPLIMGVLNVTPDSFSDGGQFVDPQKATQHALQMLAQGASIIDIGGEPTHPYAKPISVEEECQRVLPVITQLRKVSDCCISIDTSRPEVMRAAIAAGVNMINDVRALQVPGALAAVAECDLPICLMHMLGQPKTMQDQPQYDDVLLEIKQFLQARIHACLAAGIARERILIDPGFGFGKTLQHNLTLLNHLDEFKELSCPILVGLSRKAMIGHALGLPVEDRLYASTALAVIAVERGAHIIRCHDIKPTHDAIHMAHAVFMATTNAHTNTNTNTKTTVAERINHE